MENSIKQPAQSTMYQEGNSVSWGGGRGGGNLHTEFTNNDEIELKWVYPVPTILNNIYD